MGRNQTDSNSNETWLSGSSSLKTTVERHLKAIQSPLMSIGCQTGDKMHFVKFLGLIPLCAPGLVKFVPAEARLFCLALPWSLLNVLCAE